MSYRWSRSKTESLISLVFQKPLIWDKTMGPQNSHELGEVWQKLADDRGVTKARAQSKWKTLQTNFHKQRANQLKARSGDAAFNGDAIFKPGPHFQQLSFLKGNTCCQSTGNLDDESNDYDEDEQTEQPMQNSPPLLRPPTAPQSTSTKQCAVPLKLECQSVTSQELPLETEDPTKKSEWLFLLSVLDYFNKITDNTLKMQLRLEIFCLLFNFLTQNKEVINQDVSEKDQSELTVANSNKAEVSAVENLKAIDNDASKRQNLQEVIKNETSDEIESEFIDFSPITEKRIKKEIVEIDVKPSETLKTWLLNPLTIKKEM